MATGEPDLPRRPPAGTCDPAPTELRLLRRLSTAFYGLLLGAGLLWCRIRTGVWLPAEATGGRILPSLGLGAGTAVLVVVATGLAFRRLAIFRWFAGEIRGLLGPIDARSAVHLALLSAIGEEFFFRGAMQPAIGYGLTSVLFGLVHTGPNRRYLVWTAFALLLGFVLGGIQLATGSIWGPVLAHGGINAVNLWRIGRVAPETA